MLIARVFCSMWLASFMIAFGTPTDEMVMWRAPTPMSDVMNLFAASTERMLSSGSPMPMNTADSPNAKVWMYLVYLTMCTLDLRPLMVYP